MPSLVRLGGPPNPSLVFEDFDVRVTNRTGTVLELGDVVAFDLAQSDGDVSTIDEALSNVVAVAAGNVNGILGVVTDLLTFAGADNGVVSIRVQGLVSVRVADSLDAGDYLMAAAAADNLVELAKAATGNANIPVCSRGILLQDNASGGVARRQALFNGWGALGAITLGNNDT